MKTKNLSKWLTVSFLNLFVVGCLGLLMRYKSGFEFRHFEQKNLQNAHSHFAFAGWITHTIMILMIIYVNPFLNDLTSRLFKDIIIANLICAYGMLISFTIQGYGLISITFSTLSIITFFVFSYNYFKVLKFSENKNISNWLKAAIIFNLISNFGTASLTYMMATKNLPQHMYLSSIYWYLHFQYNGWFFFGCLGLFLGYLHNLFPNMNQDKNVFRLFFYSCIPAFGLSVLWLDLPYWLYLIVVASSIAQFLGWIKLILLLKNLKFLQHLEVSKLKKFLFVVIGSALSIKLTLQLVSVIPSISQFAFGFRPIVIAYLHLVLLAFVSTFLITYIFINNLITINKYTIRGIATFIIGIIFNELILSIQGFGSLTYVVIPGMNVYLIIIALVMLIGLLMINLSQIIKTKIIV